MNIDFPANDWYVSFLSFLYTFSLYIYITFCRIWPRYSMFIHPMILFCLYMGGKPFSATFSRIFMKGVYEPMNQFLCTRLRLCTYLMDRGFRPSQVLPDANNPRYSVFLFDETPELAATVEQYFTSDCLTARLNKERKDNYEHFSEEQQTRV